MLYITNLRIDYLLNFLWLVKMVSVASPFPLEEDGIVNAKQEEIACAKRAGDLELAGISVR